MAFKIADGYVDIKGNVDKQQMRDELGRFVATEHPTVTVKAKTDKKSLQSVSKDFSSQLSKFDKLSPGMTALVPALGGVASLGPPAVIGLAGIGAAGFSAFAGVGAFLGVAKELPATQKGITATSKVWDTFSHSLSGVVSPVVTKGFGILQQIIPKLRPLVVDTANAFGGLETHVDSLIKGRGFSTFLDDLGKMAGSSITAVGNFLIGLGTAFGNLVSALQPALPLIDGAASSFGKWIGQVTGTKAFRDEIGKLIAAIPGMITFLFNLGKIGYAAFKGVLSVAKPLWTDVIQPLVNFLANHTQAITQFFAAFTGGVIAIKLVGMAMGILNAVMDANPIGIIIVAIAALVAGLIYAYNHFASFHALIQSIWGWLKVNGTPIWNEIKAAIASAVGYVVAHWPQIQSVIMRVINAIVGFVRTQWPQIKAIIKDVLDLVTSIIKADIAIIEYIWRHFGSNIESAIRTAWTLIKAIISNALKIIRGVLDIATGLIHGNWKKAWNGVKEVLSGVWGLIKGIVKAGINSVKNELSVVMKLISSAWGKAWGGIKSVASGIWGGIKSSFKSGVDDLVGIVNGLIGKINWLLGKLHVAKIPTIGLPYPKGSGQSSGGSSGGSGQSKAFAAGGVYGSVMPGYTPGRDVHQFYSPTGGRLALAGGEGILVPEATAALGGERGIDAINARFRRGGRGGTAPEGHYFLGGVISSIGSHVKSLLGEAAAATLKPALTAVEAGVNRLPIPGFFKSIADGGLNSVLGWLNGDVAKKDAAKKAAGGSARGDMSAHSASAAAAQAYARSILPQFGWGPGEMGAETALWNGESGWNNLAKNPASSAFGIAQFLDGTWAGKRFPKTTNYKQQIWDGDEYIAGAYGTPTNALGKWLGRNPHWYDTGGKIPPGLSLAYNGTGRTETVRTSPQENALQAQLHGGGRGGGMTSADIAAALIEGLRGTQLSLTRSGARLMAEFVINSNARQARYL